MSTEKYNYVRKTARYNGKKYEATGKTEREALLKLSDKLSAAKRGEETICGDMTVDAWFEQWLSTYKEPKGLTPKSFRMYREKYGKYIQPHIGRMKLKNVTDVHLTQIMNEQKGMSESHVKKVRLVMEGMFKQAKKSRFIPINPAEDLELPAYEKRKRRSITDEERAAILAVAETHRSGLWILTLLYTGMRSGESAALTWGDIDFEKDSINIHAAKESGSTRIKTPKTDAGSRVFPHIPNAIRGKLEAASVGKKKTDPVFPTQRGNFQNENSLRRLWTGFKRDLDIYMGATVYRNKIVKSVVAEDLVPYCLRHTFCTDCARAKVPIDTVRWLMGHEDISVTANIYQDAHVDVLKTGLELLEKDDMP